MKSLEERVDRLEMALAHLIDEMADFKKWVLRYMAESDRRIEEYRAETDRKIEEYRAQVDEEIRKYRDETDRKIEEYRAQIDREISQYRNELKEANRRWGEIANRLGTLVEDIIYPALRPVIRKYFQCEPEKTAVRLVYSKRDAGIREEFDAVAVCDEMVFLLEVKSTPREKHIEEFKEKAKRFLQYFPEYAGRRLILIMGSLSFDEGFVKKLSEAGIYAMAYREWEYMDILNFEEVRHVEER